MENERTMNLAYVRLLSMYSIHKQIMNETMDAARGCKNEQNRRNGTTSEMITTNIQVDFINAIVYKTHTAHEKASFVCASCSMPRAIVSFAFT